MVALLCSFPIGILNYLLNNTSIVHCALICDFVRFKSIFHHGTISFPFLPPTEAPQVTAIMRHSIPLLSLACLILFVVHRVRGHSDGAPEESCASLTVRHVHLAMQVMGEACGSPCLSHQLRLMGSSADNFTYNCSQTYQRELAYNPRV